MTSTYACCADYPHLCPGCRLVMSHREWDEQRVCNECSEAGVDVPIPVYDEDELRDFPPADAYLRGPGYRGP